MTGTTVFVPRDAGALSIGAERPPLRDRPRSRVRGPRGHDHPQRLARNVLAGAAGGGGTRQRVAWPTGRSRRPRCRGCSTPVSRPGQTPARLGRPKQSPGCKSQQRLACARIGVIVPACADYEAHGGLAGLRRALAMAPADIVREVSSPACAAVAARRFPTGASGAPCSNRRRREIHHLQCRRGRLRHLRRPPADRGRSAGRSSRAW